MEELRRCAKCGNEYPASTEYFYRVSTRQRKDGLGSWCKACHNQSSSRTNAKSREKARERNRRYCLAHPNKRKESQRRYSHTHAIEERAKKKRWRENNPEKAKAEVERRRAIRTQAEGTYTADDIKAQYARQKGKCHWCSKKLNGQYHVDHIVPLSRGGTNWPDNLVCACEYCNTSKGAKLPHEWSKSGRLL